MNTGSQVSLFADVERSLLDELLAKSRLYTSSSDYKKLLDFVVCLPTFAPFNAMLLQVQKPGLTYAASASEWEGRFGRRPKEGARPLLILWPFGPVALVYDVQDTEGAELPAGVSSFFARGPMTADRVERQKGRLPRHGVRCVMVDAGDSHAGSIRVTARAGSDQDRSTYSIALNRNHDANVQFATLAHELGHLCLGHLGPDSRLAVPRRRQLTHAEVELEAESVSYLVCKRNGVASKAEAYLAKYVSNVASVEALDLYHVLRAAGQVETLLGVATPAKLR